jgi:membrane protein DedA with SNARE-associated domain
MIEALFALVPVYGAGIVFAITLISCLGVPVPGSLALLAAGAFAASGDLSIPAAIAAAFGGAVIGDQLGYGIGASGGRLAERLTTRPGMAALLDQAHALALRWGAPGIFFSRWLVSPLGPAINLISGMTGFPWVRFTLWGIAGEVVWVALYFGLGFAFGASIAAVADLMGNLAWFLAAAAVTFLLGFRLHGLLNRD